MESEASGEVFTKNNDKLLNVAKTADVLFWIGVVLIPVFCIISILQYNDPTQPQIFRGLYSLFSNSLFGIQFLGKILKVIFNGVVVVLILRGISLGLRMIVETDVNYRLSGEDK